MCAHKPFWCNTIFILSFLLFTMFSSQNSPTPFSLGITICQIPRIIFIATSTTTCTYSRLHKTPRFSLCRSEIEAALLPFSK